MANTTIKDPQKRGKQITLYLSKETHDMLKELSIREGQTMSGMVKTWIHRNAKGDKR